MSRTILRTHSYTIHHHERTAAGFFLPVVLWVMARIDVIGVFLFVYWVWLCGVVERACRSAESVPWSFVVAKRFPATATATALTLQQLEINKVNGLLPVVSLFHSGYAATISLDAVLNEYPATECSN